ncbi:MAG: hypothetical protein QXR60_03810 [Candidatus Nanoarchaeia archaeon]
MVLKMAKFDVTRWLSDERRRYELLKDKYAIVCISGLCALILFYVLTLYFGVVMTPSVYVLVVVVSVGTLWGFLKYNQVSSYLKGIDTFYLKTQYLYHKKGKVR